MTITLSTNPSFPFLTVTDPSQQGVAYVFNNAMQRIQQEFSQHAAAIRSNSGAVSGQPLTEVNDTNVTMALSGTPGSALLQPVTMTLGWTGTLAAGRLNANVVQSVTNDTNVTGSISAQNLTLGWQGTLAVPRGGTGVGTFTTNGVLYGNGTGALQVTAQGGANTVLAANAGAPAFSTSPTLTSLTLTGGLTAASASISGNTTTGSLTISTLPFGGPLFLANSNVVYSTNISVVTPGENGVVGNGSTNDEAAIASLIAASGEVWVMPGQYAIGTNLTVGTGKRIKFMIGAQFNIATGITVDFSGSEVDAPLGKQIFSLAGTGQVIGLMNSSPEQFGAARSGGGNDAPAIAAAIIAVSSIGANSTITGRPTCWLASGKYFCNSVITILLPNSGPMFRVQGAGSWTTPTTLIFGSGLSNIALAFYQQQNGNLSFSLNDFQIVNQTAGSGCSIGLDIGQTAANSQTINTSDQLGLIMVDHMWVSGFANNVRYIGCAGILTQYCQFWGLDSTFSNLTTNATHVLITPNHTGQQACYSDFFHNTFVNDSGASAIGVKMQDAGFANAGCAGPTFERNIFYSGTGGGSSIVMSATAASSNSGIVDIWINPSNQFENQHPGSTTIAAIQMDASNGALIYDIHIEGAYFDGQGWGVAINGVQHDNLSTLGNIYIIGNYFENPVNCIQITGSASGGGSRGYVVCNNMFAIGTNSTNLIIFTNLVGDITCSNNNSYIIGASTSATGISFAGVGSKAVAIGNNTNSTTPVSIAGGWTVTQANNI